MLIGVLRFGPMDKVQRQIQIATEVALRHGDSHPFQVALMASVSDDLPVPDFQAFIVGLLHDSLEDGYCTEKVILDIFGGEICNTVEMLTRGDGERYFDYIERIKRYGTPIALKVKLADARVNLARCETNLGYGGLAHRYRRVIEELTTTDA
jgi:hypothetical protein